MNRLPDERDMDQVVRSWMREEDERPADRNRQVGRIMGRVDETRQRRRAWRLLPFGRGTKPVDEADDELVAPGRTGLAASSRAVAPSLLAIVTVLALVVGGYGYLALGPSVAPGAGELPTTSPQPTVNPADVPVLTRMGTELWKGPDSDFSTAMEVYAEDAVHSVLWLDEEERIEGAFGIWSRMRESERVDSTSEEDWIRLPDHAGGARRYLGYSPSVGGTSCVVWIEDEQITRHDCILPLSFEFDPQAPGSIGDLWQPVDSSVDPLAVAARERLTSALAEGKRTRDREALSEIVAPDVIHHVLSANQAYTVEGFSDWAAIMTTGSITMRVNVDLPAPAGELRWANFTNIGSGSLCVFWAQDGRVTRHDCVVPGTTTVSTSRMSDPSPAADTSPEAT